ncbi:type II toxin-antitoxin system RelE/ParE family toxin [Thalassospira sp.]|uniref:type II toxin-antitoxin system RelE/ParE family toxin n=1 Tax=Thalassospira sp. TaxID=1912094 RepID=UPI003AA7D042
MAVSPGYRLTPKAAIDLEDIWRYTQRRWSVMQAEKYIREILQVFAELAGATRQGQKCDVRDGYFKIPVGAHVIYYRQAPDAIEVVRILHGRMDVARHL